MKNGYYRLITVTHRQGKRVHLFDSPFYKDPRSTTSYQTNDTLLFISEEKNIEIRKLIYKGLAVAITALM